MLCDDERTHEIDYGAKTRYTGAEIAEGYDRQRFSGLLGRWVDRLEKKTLMKCLRELDQGDAILDIPMGTARIMTHLLSKGFRVAGADISEEMMAVGRKRLEGNPNYIGVYQQDAEHLTFSDKSFDAIVSVRFMGHLPSPIRIKVLKEMKRVAKKIVVVAYYVSGMTTDISKFLQGIGRKSGHILYPAKEKDIREELKEAGLEILKDYPMLRFVSECHFLVLRPKGL
jgi:ubiquinone/menaquinone biosynthesis C-methylase UbiE